MFSRGPRAFALAGCLLLAACSGAAEPSPSAAPAASPTSSATSDSSPSPVSPTASTSTLKIGVVVDVGRVDDKNFNQYSYEGAKQAAQQLGAEVNYVVPKDASDYDKDIQGFVDQKYNVIVTVGFNFTSATARAAKANPDIWFIGVDEAPCVDESGNPDDTFTCAGDAAKLLPKLIGLQFQEDQPGYLAGIVAAAVSKSGVIGAIGGIATAPSNARYLQGYELGAKSYKPDIQVKFGFFSTGDMTKAFGDPTWGKTYGAEFIQQQGVDVLFPVAGGTGNAALDAACDAGILAIGVDVDEYQSYPSADACLVTSAEKHLSTAVSQTIMSINDGTAKGGIRMFDASNDGIGYSPFHNAAISVPADVQGKLDTAIAGMKAGTVTTCPTNCGTWSGS